MPPQVSREAIEALAQRLSDLDLNDSESAILFALLSRAESASSDVEGFLGFTEVEWSVRRGQGGTSYSGGDITGEKLAISLGFDVLTDFDA